MIPDGILNPQKQIHRIRNGKYGKYNKIYKYRLYFFFTISLIDIKLYISNPT